MSNATKPRKRVKPERPVAIDAPTNGVFAIRMTIGAGETAKHFGYYVQPIPADFGLGFHFEKFDVEKIEGEPSGSSWKATDGTRPKRKNWSTTPSSA